MVSINRIDSCVCTVWSNTGRGGIQRRQWSVLTALTLVYAPSGQTPVLAEFKGDNGQY